MRVGLRWSFPLFLTISALPAHSSAQIAPGIPPQTAQVEDVADSSKPNPQIVRISYLEGDVRLSRGRAGQKATGDAWDKAAVDIPLESGFSLATGKGRAEIEFEDASTAYLGENSALVFGNLTTTGEVPSTTFSLLAGTLTLRLRPTFPGERYLIKTPAGDLSLAHPMQDYIRVNSYLDAVAFTPQEDTTVDVLLSKDQGPHRVCFSGFRPARDPRFTSEMACGSCISAEPRTSLHGINGSQVA